MVTLTEGRHAGGYIVSEANGHRSREKITIASGIVSAGMVLGIIALGAATPAAVAGNTGQGEIGAVTVGAGAKAGVYRVTCVEPGSGAGKFTVEDPDGVTVGVATVGVAFSGGGLGFTIADGDPDFVSGDSFTITVAAGSGAYVAFDPDADDGSAVAAAIAFDNADATDAPVEIAATVRDSEVSGVDLVWPEGIEPGEKAAAIADLARLGIIVR